MQTARLKIRFVKLCEARGLDGMHQSHPGKLCAYLNRFLTFSNRFILIRVTMDPEPIPGTLGVSQEYTLDEMPVHYRAPQHTHTLTHSFIHSFTLLGN